MKCIILLFALKKCYIKKISSALIFLQNIIPLLLLIKINRHMYCCCYLKYKQIYVCGKQADHACFFFKLYIVKTMIFRDCIYEEILSIVFVLMNVILGCGLLPLVEGFICEQIYLSPTCLPENV